MDLLKRSLLLAGLLCAFFIVVPLPGIAQVNAGVHIGSPPPYRTGAPPPVVVIPRTYVYFIPDIDADIFFYAGNWYRLYQGHWFSARSYSGSWSYVPDPGVPRALARLPHGIKWETPDSFTKVPRALVQLPPDYRHIPPGWRRIPYGQLRKNWAGWERDHYWESTIGVQYQLNKYVSFQAGYTYRNNSTNVPADFTDNVFSISGTVRY